ncbi:MAG: phospho-N-acetylmuramoyl-pentapeptide-transferase [Lachnospiraceae bacterium]|nr:phospho-N-acetylmuramoyl-pentapeptide-transferase [Lachnospiraceae bacterium]
MLLYFVVPLIASFAVSAAVGPILIPYLRKLKIGQTVREEGPESHLKKNGTPTMGGIQILLAFAVVGFCFAGVCPRVLPVILLTLLFGLIGFLDDYIKVVLKRSLGLRAWQKFGLQIIGAAVYIFYIYHSGLWDLTWRIPFSEQTLDLGIWNIPLLFILILGAVNGTNFTDGLDGLASSVTIIVCVFYVVASALIQTEHMPVVAAMMGALFGFMLYNHYPAKVFMGDTGSLALGGFVAALSIQMQLELFLVIVGFIYVAEVGSVILQVGYFKLTHGKRIFLMAPIHHHYEKKGMQETSVVLMFALVTALLVAVGIVGLVY